MSLSTAGIPGDHSRALRYAGYTDVGRRRSHNDDRWSADPTQCLYIVADGVGSASRGGLAAQLATELLPAYLLRHRSGLDLGDPDTAALLGHAVAQLSDDLYARTQAEPKLAAAQTTVVAAVVTATRASVAHLGDSRAYLYRDPPDAPSDPRSQPHPVPH
jgi:protein phosphatase